MELTLVVTGSGIGTLGCSFVLACLAQLIGFGIPRGIKGGLDTGSNHLAEMLFELFLVNFYDIIQVVTRLCRIVVLHD